MFLSLSSAVVFFIFLFTFNLLYRTYFRITITVSKSGGFVVVESLFNVAPIVCLSFMLGPCYVMLYVVSNHLTEEE